MGFVATIFLKGSLFSLALWGEGPAKGGGRGGVRKLGRKVALVEGFKAENL